MEKIHRDCRKFIKAYKITTSNTKGVTYAEWKRDCQSAHLEGQELSLMLFP